MTTLPLDLLRKLQAAAPHEAWRELFAFAWETCCREITSTGVAGEISRRDRAVAPADLFLATAGWDLWSSYYHSVSRTADRLAAWWGSISSGRAVLILDGLSLREAPWLICGATERGYVVHSAEATGAELPADTNPFARALGFGQRSALENNGASNAHRLPGARTDSVDLPWRECVDLVDASPDWVLWHHWPDERIHELSSPGRGLALRSPKKQQPSLQTTTFGHSLNDWPPDGDSSSRVTTATRPPDCSPTPRTTSRPSI